MGEKPQRPGDPRREDGQDWTERVIDDQEGIPLQMRRHNVEVTLPRPWGEVQPIALPVDCGTVETWEMLTAR